MQAVEAVQPAPASSRVVRPAWMARPDAPPITTTLARFGLVGAAEVRLRCRVTLQGTVADCRVASSTSEDPRWGQAALAYSPYFLFSPETVDGVATDTGVVTIPVRMSVADARAGRRR